MARPSAAEGAPEDERWRDQWRRTRRVRVGPWSVRVREAGAGPTLVLVHGLGISVDFWRHNAPAMAAAGYHVVAADLPGFGRTAGPRRGLKVEEQARFTFGLVAALGIERAVYLGHSISCRTVLEMAAAVPDAVRGLVLAAPSEGGGAGMMARQAGRLVVDAFRERPSLLALAALNYFQAGPVRYWRTWRWGVQRDLLDVAPHVDAPALVIRGERDPVVPESFARRLAETLPRGRYLPIANAAHSLLWDRPAAVNRELIGFLREVNE